MIRPPTSYDRTQAWLFERNNQAAANKMAIARYFDRQTAPFPGMELPKRAPYVEPVKPASIGEVVEDVGYLGNKIVQRIKRIVGV